MKLKYYNFYHINNEKIFYYCINHYLSYPTFGMKKGEQIAIDFWSIGKNNIATNFNKGIVITNDL